MSFLRLPAGALVNARGGLVLADPQADLAVAFQNPALLEPHWYSRLHSSFLLMPGGSKGYFLSGTVSNRKQPYVSALSIHYIDHGRVPLTDAGGSNLGDFRPREWSIQYAASIPYRSRWRGGAGVQFAHSAYGQYRAAAFLTNVGIRYRDTTHGLEAGMILRHTGFFVRRYDAGSTPALPVELAFGVWKKWVGTPFSFGAVLQRMQRWHLDTDEQYNSSLSFTGLDNRRSTLLGQFFNHLILSTQVELHPSVKLLGGYNFLRRRELSWSGGMNGLAGFSMGVQAQLDRIRLSYGRTHYQAGAALDQLSIEYALKNGSKGWRK